MDYLLVGKLEFFKCYTWIYDTDQYEALNRTVFCGSHILASPFAMMLLTSFKISVILSRRESRLVILLWIVEKRVAHCFNDTLTTTYHI